MIKRTIISLTILAALLTTGCTPLEWFLTDINGWDLSACVDGFDTCWELFTDNQDRILGGEESITDTLLDLGG